jgi:hypothetical protein
VQLSSSRVNTPTGTADPVGTVIRLGIELDMNEIVNKGRTEFIVLHQTRSL